MVANQNERTLVFNRKTMIKKGERIECRNCGEVDLWCQCGTFDFRPDARQAEIQRLIGVYGLGRAGHSHFSPSSSAGWLNCRGFLLANAGKPDVAGVDAAYGTVAHAVAALWLVAIRDEGRKKAERVPKRFLGMVKTENGFKITIDANMIYHIRRYIDWCAEVEMMGDVFIETHVDYSIYTPIPNQGGTADHCVCIPPVIDEDGKLLGAGELIITDLKMGIGVPVHVEGNTQAMLYALGFFLEWNWLYSFGRITIRICQPRLDYFRQWSISRDDLLAFGEEVRVKSDQAWVENAPRTPSEKACQWCADKSCVARSAFLQDLVDDVFDDDDSVAIDKTVEYPMDDLEAHAAGAVDGDLKPPPKFNTKMTIAVMSWRYKQRRFFEKYFREIGDELKRLIQSGVKVPDWKIVNGRRSFDWLDSEHAANQLYEAGLKENEVYKTEVTSVAQAAKLLKAKGVPPKELQAILYDGDRDNPGPGSLVKIVPGRPTLAPVGDDRTDLGDEFDEAIDDDEL